MCEPSTLAAATLAVSVAGTAASFIGQQQQADSMEGQARSNADAIRQDTVNSYEQLQLRRVQERDAAIEEKMSAQSDAVKARSAARVSAGEAGVSGLSVDALMADYYGQEGRYADSVDRNYENTSQQIDQEMRGVQAAGTTRINSLPRGQRPSFLDAGLRIAGAGLKAYDVYATESARQRRADVGR